MGWVVLGLVSAICVWVVLSMIHEHFARKALEERKRELLRQLTKNHYSPVCQVRTPVAVDRGNPVCIDPALSEVIGDLVSDAIERAYSSSDGTVEVNGMEADDEDEEVQYPVTGDSMLDEAVRLVIDGDPGAADEVKKIIDDYNRETVSIAAMHSASDASEQRTGMSEMLYGSNEPEVSSSPTYYDPSPSHDSSPSYDSSSSYDSGSSYDSSSSDCGSSDCGGGD